MMHEVVIGMGSNINAEINFASALFFLKEEHELMAVSNPMRTAPIGIKEQPDFLNAAAKVKTDLSPDEFRAYLKGLEDRLKRDRQAPKYGPRTIDLDIIVWDGQIIDNDYFERDFVKTVVDEIL